MCYQMSMKYIEIADLLPEACTLIIHLASSLSSTSLCFGWAGHASRGRESQVLCFEMLSILIFAFFPISFVSSSLLWDLDRPHSWQTLHLMAPWAPSGIRVNAQWQGTLAVTLGNKARLSIIYICFKSNLVQFFSSFGVDWYLPLPTYWYINSLDG